MINSIITERVLDTLMEEISQKSKKAETPVACKIEEIKKQQLEQSEKMKSYDGDLTPLGGKFALFCLINLCAMVTCAVLIVNMGTIMAVAAVALLVLETAVPVVYYRIQDLNSSTDLLKAQRQIQENRGLTFKKLSKEYSKDKVVRYNLLLSRLPDSNEKEHDRLVRYVQFQELGEMSKLFKAEDIERAFQKYVLGIVPPLAPPAYEASAPLAPPYEALAS